MADRTQENRVVSVRTPLADDVLLIRSMTATEQLGRLFRIDLRLFSEKDAEVKFDRLLGKDITVKLAMANNEWRYFNGYVSRFAQTRADGGVAEYRATLSPWLWFLTRAADCRVYQNQSAPEIIKSVFGLFDVAKFELRLKRSYPALDYCVQYRETAFNFVSRLMEQAGIYYFFEHKEDRHKMVLCDDPHAHDSASGCDSLPYRPLNYRLHDQEYVWDLGLEQELRPGKYATTDYDFTTPAKSLKSSANSPKPRKHERASYEVFDYPGGFTQASDGQDYAKLRIEEEQAQFEQIRGMTNARGLATGHLFKLTDSLRQDRNLEYLVSGAVHQVESDEYGSQLGAAGAAVYSCSFTAIDSTETFRSIRLTPKPVVQGPQTARVVGTAGQELDVDKYGRVKVQFYWDRYGEKDEKSSCYIRVGQAIAGNRWGACFWPRIGQEVIVSFLEGDPDQPIITGSVYNGEQLPPYLKDGPDDKHPNDPLVSGIKTNSSPGGKGFNELRFDDNQGKEQVFIHAERNMDVRVKNDSLERVFGNRHIIIGWQKDGDKGGDVRELIYQDQHLDVKRNQITHVEGNAQLTIGKGEADDGGNFDLVIEKDRTELVEQNQHLHVKADLNEKIDGNVSLSVGSSQQQKVGQNHALDAGQDIYLKAGMTVIIEAGVQLSLKVGGNFIDIGPSGVTIQGTMVMINSGGAAGSGTDASPTTPAEAQVANPTKPTLADDAKSGDKSAQ